LSDITRRKLSPQGGDSVEEPTAVAEGADAQLLQVLCGHPAQDLTVDVIVAEKLGVLFEAQPVQPRRYVHAVILSSESGNPSSMRIFLSLSTYQRQN
jgi:hypothetical protein